MNEINAARLGSRFFFVSLILFCLAGLTIAIHFLLRLYPMSDPEIAAPPHAVDFTLYWAAAKLSYMGDPLAVFDRDAIVEAAGLLDAPKVYPWLYPPLALVVITPLGALGYTSAVLLYAMLGLTALWAAIRSPAAVVPGLGMFVLSSPVLVIGSVMIGQVSAFLTAAFVGALGMLFRGNPAMAGLLFAVLTIKPQLGLMIPIALAAARQWKVIGWTVIWVVVLNLIATLVTGFEFWLAFLDSTSFIADYVSRAGSTAKLHLMTSIYGFCRVGGLSHGDALAIQIGAAFLVAVSVAWVWSREDVGNDLKCATLLAAVPLATPYAYYYELALVLAAMVFLIRSGFGGGILAGVWLGILWLGPLPGFLLPAFLPPALVLPPVVLVTYGICLARVAGARARRADPEEIRGLGG